MLWIDVLDFSANCHEFFLTPLQLAEEGMMFDPYMNDVWATRNSALDKFIQAARKVRIQFSLKHSQLPRI